MRAPAHIFSRGKFRIGIAFRGIRFARVEIEGYPDVYFHATDHTCDPFPGKTPALLVTSGPCRIPKRTCAASRNCTSSQRTHWPRGSKRMYTVCSLLHYAHCHANPIHRLHPHALICVKHGTVGSSQSGVQCIQLCQIARIALINHR